MIKLRCKLCKFSFEVSEKEFIEYPEAYKDCYISCGGENEVVNLDEIVEKDIYTRAEEYINKWFKEIGIEATIEMCERNREQSCFRIYRKILESKGFKIKGE